MPMLTKRKMTSSGILLALVHRSSTYYVYLILLLLLSSAITVLASADTVKTIISWEEAESVRNHNQEKETLWALAKKTSAIDPKPESTISNNYHHHQQRIIRQRREQFQFQLPDDFYDGKCDPCIPRTDYRMRAIVHGTMNSVYWQQVESALHQASRDTGIDIQVTLYSPEDIDSDLTIPERMAADIAAIADNQNHPPDALIVTIPSPEVERAVTTALQSGIPVFGFHTGYQVAAELGVLGFVAQDEVTAGQVVAHQLMQTTNATIRSGGGINNSTTEFIRVAYINHDIHNRALKDRYSGLQSVLMTENENANNSGWSVEQVVINLKDVFESVNIMEENVFQDCPYDAVVLGGQEDVDIALSAYTGMVCSGKTLLVTFGVSETIQDAIINGQIAFAAAPQDYLQSVFVGMMAGMYVTTGKKLSLPYESSVYLSGPMIITEDNVPTDTQQTCLEQAFPVCDVRGNPFEQDKATTINPNGLTERCNGGCLNRQDIRLGGVLHGVSSDSFWDPVFAASRQAALDMGITLELERFEPEQTTDLVHEKMAARVRTLCESGVDGIFVTIPSEELIAPIQLCQSLNIPVVSINAGADISERLGLMHHV